MSCLSEWACMAHVVLMHPTRKFPVRPLWVSSLEAHMNCAVSCSTGRPPGPEMEYCTDRESYSLAAGLALGMVCLGVSSLPLPAVWPHVHVGVSLGTLEAERRSTLPWLHLTWSPALSSSWMFCKVLDPEMGRKGSKEWGFKLSLPGLRYTYSWMN